MNQMRWIPLGALLAAGLLLAGCRQQAAPEPANPSDSAPPTTMTSTGDTTMVSVSLKDYTITLSPKEAPAGNVMFHITNDGKDLHAIRVEGKDLDKSSANVKAGEKTALQIDNMKPGTYEVDCPVGDHEDRGMKTTFTVTGK